MLFEDGILMLLKLISFFSQLLQNTHIVRAIFNQWREKDLLHLFDIQRMSIVFFPLLFLIDKQNAIYLAVDRFKAGRIWIIARIRIFFSISKDFNWFRLFPAFLAKILLPINIEFDEIHRCFSWINWTSACVHVDQHICCQNANFSIDNINNRCYIAIKNSKLLK